MLQQNANQSMVVFPFLKTHSPARLGGLTFRPTDVTDHLSEGQLSFLRDVADMLFLKDDLHIRSASYAFVPFIDPDFPAAAVEHLAYVQQVVAYCYAAPRHSFGDIFLTPEHASLVIFTPHRVSVHLVHPTFHGDPVGPAPDLAVDQFGNMPGYAGLYNFRHHFWVTKDSRLHGPLPHMGLNMAQDLGHDLARAAAARADYRLLIDWLGRPVTPTSSRVFTALRWFNAANSRANDDAAALVDLAIAFEALLSLPADEKTDRLVDAISLLLGRTPRLDIWARQFYDARSKVAHEGHAQQVRFDATDSRRRGDGPLYQSLLSYGRQIFQLCLGALLVGAELAHDAGLEETLVTNQERFQKICTVLADESVSTGERLSG